MPIYIYYDNQCFGPLGEKAAALLLFNLDLYGVEYRQSNEPIPASDVWNEEETIRAVIGMPNPEDN